MLYWLNPALASVGNLQLVRLTNPLAPVLPKALLYGEVSNWTSDQMILWGTQICDPEGQMILWGTQYTTDGTMILWGTSMTDQDPK